MKEGQPLKAGRPCSHPGCAAHLSHPCEECGRYAAGLANGPDIETAKAYIRKLALDDPTIFATLQMADVLGWTWEQTLTSLVISFHALSKELLEQAVTLAFRNPNKHRPRRL